jgi:hypothetical protein
MPENKPLNQKDLAVRIKREREIEEKEENASNDRPLKKQKTEDIPKRSSFPPRDPKKTKLAVALAGDSKVIEPLTLFALQRCAETRPKRKVAKGKLHTILSGHRDFLMHINAFNKGVEKADPELFQEIQHYESCAVGSFTLDGKFGLPTNNPIGDHTDLVTWTGEEEKNELDYPWDKEHKLWQERKGEQPFKATFRTEKAFEGIRSCLTNDTAFATQVNQSTTRIAGIVEANQAKGASFRFGKNEYPPYESIDANLVFETLKDKEQYEVGIARALQEELYLPQPVAAALAKGDAHSTFTVPTVNTALGALLYVSPQLAESSGLPPILTDVLAGDLRSKLKLSHQEPDKAAAYLKEVVTVFVCKAYKQWLKGGARSFGFSNPRDYDSLQETFLHVLVTAVQHFRGKFWDPYEILAAKNSTQVLKVKTHVTRLCCDLACCGFLKAKWREDKWKFAFLRE